MRLFLVCDDSDFSEWIIEELAETGRFVRNLDSFNFFIPQWEAAGGADVIIFPETALPSDGSFLRLYRAVHTESPETKFLFIHQSSSTDLTEQLKQDGHFCISYDELDTGLLEKVMRHGHNSPSQITAIESATTELESISLTESEVMAPAPLDEQSTISRPAASNERLNEEQADSIANTVSASSKESESNEAPATVDLGTAQEKTEQTKNVANKQQKKKRTAAEQKEKLARIKERIIIEEKIVTIHVPIHINSKLISIVSLYPRAGATFITSNFARLLGENKIPVAVLEPVLDHIGSTYYEMMHGEVNAPKKWKPWSEQIAKTGAVGNDTEWKSHGVSWIPSSTEPLKSWSEEQNMKLLLTANRYPITLCDISSHHNNDHCKRIMAMSDEIWIVAEGDPVALSHHYKTIDGIKSEFKNKSIRIIGNRWNRYIDNSEWKEAVLLPTLTTVPDLGTVVMKQLWSGKMAWDDTRLKNLLASPLKPLARTVVAKEMHYLLKKQYGLKAKFQWLFKVIKSLDDETKTKKGPTDSKGAQHEA